MKSITLGTCPKILNFLGCLSAKIDRNSAAIVVSYIEFLLEDIEELFRAKNWDCLRKVPKNMEDYEIVVTKIYDLDILLSYYTAFPETVFKEDVEDIIFALYLANEKEPDYQEFKNFIKGCSPIDDYSFMVESNPYINYDKKRALKRINNFIHLLRNEEEFNLSDKLSAMCDSNMTLGGCSIYLPDEIHKPLWEILKERREEKEAAYYRLWPEQNADFYPSYWQ